MGKRKSDKCSNYPSLDKTHLREGYFACLENARRLINDATVLGNAGCFRTGYLSVLLASEELGKSIWLCKTQALQNINQWQKWWEGYRDHYTKQASCTLFLVAKDEPPEKWHEIFIESKEGYKPGKNVVQLRMKGMYVDFDLKNKKFVSPPNDKEMKNDFEQEISFAKGLLQELSSYSF